MTALTTRAAELAEAVESYLTAGSFGDGRIVAGTAAAYYRGAGRAGHRPLTAARVPEDGLAGAGF